MKIPGWADAAADRVGRHRWLTAASAVNAATLVLLLWLPAYAWFGLGVFTGVCLTWGAGRDKRLLAAAQHDADQLEIGRLRGENARLKARPAADAPTLATPYIPTPKGDSR